jgi:hypothetical protein
LELICYILFYALSDLGWPAGFFARYSGSVDIGFFAALSGCEMYIFGRYHC